jgi:hypothetical protein
MPKVNAKNLLAGAINSRSMHEYFPSPTQSHPQQHQSTSQQIPTPAKRFASSPPSFHKVDEKDPNLTEICKGINAMYSVLNSVKETVENTNTFMANVASKANKNEIRIDELSSSTAYLEQCQLNDRIEISSRLPMNIDAKLDVKQQVLKLFSDLKITVDPVEVVTAYLRKWQSKNGENKIITVILVHAAVKQRILRDKMQLRTELAANFYFNEVLSARNRSIIFRARELKRAGKFFKAGSVNGQIYIMKAKEGDKIFIANISELEELAKINVEQCQDRLTNNKKSKA